MSEAPAKIPPKNSLRKASILLIGCICLLLAWSSWQVDESSPSSQDKLNLIPDNIVAQAPILETKGIAPLTTAHKKEEIAKLKEEIGGLKLQLIEFENAMNQDSLDESHAQELKQQLLYLNSELEKEKTKSAFLEQASLELFQAKNDLYQKQQEKQNELKNSQENFYRLLGVYCTSCDAQKISLEALSDEKDRGRALREQLKESSWAYSDLETEFNLYHAYNHHLLEELQRQKERYCDSQTALLALQNTVEELNIAFALYRNESDQLISLLDQERWKGKILQEKVNESQEQLKQYTHELIALKEEYIQTKSEADRLLESLNGKDKELLFLTGQLQDFREGHEQLMEHTLQIEAERNEQQALLATLQQLIEEEKKNHLVAQKDLKEEREEKRNLLEKLQIEKEQLAAQAKFLTELESYFKTLKQVMNAPQLTAQSE